MRDKQANGVLSCIPPGPSPEFDVVHLHGFECGELGYIRATGELSLTSKSVLPLSCISSSLLIVMVHGA
eukprot:5576167-Alexandrium_andersonii.AAC.1